MRKNKIYSQMWKVLGITGIFSILFGGRFAWQTIRECVNDAMSYIRCMVKNESDTMSAWHAANGQNSSEAMAAWFEQNAAKGLRSPQLILVATDPFEDFEINFKNGNSDSLSFVQMLGENLQISGRIDVDHKYFEGKAVWNGKEIYLLDFESKEYVLLKKEIRSCMIGDYYISTRFQEEKGEMEILIFYCV